MQGSITQRSPGTWTIRYDVPGLDGKRKQKTVTVRGTKKAAQAELARLLNEVNTGGYCDPSRMTVGQYLEQWLSDYVDVNLAGTTRERYRGVCRNHLIPGLGSIPLAKLRAADIQAHHSKTLAEGRKNGIGPLDARSVLYHHLILGRALKQATRLQLIPRNPCQDVTPPRKRHTEMKVLDDAQLKKLVETAKGTELYLPIIMATTTGMRRGEILGLRWQDVDLEAASLSVRQSLEQTKQGIRAKVPKTNRSCRVVDLPALTVRLLRKHREAQDELRELMGTAYQENDLVISQPDGTPMRPDRITWRFVRIVKQAGVPRVRFHDLRHSHATLLLTQNVHPKIVSERLGHASVAITLDLYSHVVPGIQRVAADRVDAALGSLDAEPIP